jgi:invasion protein IalB
MESSVCVKWYFEHLLGGTVSFVGSSSVKCIFAVTLTQTVAVLMHEQTQYNVQTSNVETQEVSGQCLPTCTSLPQTLGIICNIVATAKGVPFQIPDQFGHSHAVQSGGLTTKTAMAYAVPFVCSALRCSVSVTMQTKTTHVISVGSHNDVGVVIFDSTMCVSTCLAAREPSRHIMPVTLTIPTYMWASRDSGVAIVETCRVVLALVRQILTAPQ